MQLVGNIVDIRNRKIFHGRITWEGPHITSIDRIAGTSPDYLMPGFIDAHVHIESSMLVPTEFSRMAAPHGTVATVSDPHEIANVLGMEGIDFMIRNGNQAALKFHFGAPSCVPATSFETAGANLGPTEIRDLLAKPEILYLAEMMNYPGVLSADDQVMEKMAIAGEFGKPIDGHAPGLRGKDADRYFAAGITTDHECFSYEEGWEKANLGVKILIREGSAAKNYEVLHPLMDEFPKQIMFCSDDKHPDDLMRGHINQMAARAIADGHDLYDVLGAACLNPVDHYGLPIGTLQVGDRADFIVVNNLTEFKTAQTYIDGQLVADVGQSLEARVDVLPINYFETKPKTANDFEYRTGKTVDTIKVIEALDGQLITRQKEWEPRVLDDQVLAQPEKDILKIVVVNRYADKLPAVAFITGFGLRQGAIASCVAHDSHNIIAVGMDDASLCSAINLVIAKKGGISAVSGDQEMVLPLPVAGIMSDEPGPKVAEKYGAIDRFSKEILGSTLTAPFMTLSFMGLLVIPQLKLSDLGLFDGASFQFVD